jgi:hypothetical protein
MMRSVLLLVGLYGVLAGCSWTNGSAGPAASSQAAEPGTIAGRVMLLGSGVQFPGVKGPFPATNTPFTFVAVLGRQMFVRKVKTDAKARFRLAIPPGRYRVGATFTASAPLRPAAKKVILVRPGQVTRVGLTEGVR